MVGIRISVVAACCLAGGVVAAVIDVAGTGYQQDFTGAGDSLPAGWQASVDGLAVQPVPGTGSATGGGVYGFRAPGSSESCLGTLASGAATPLLFGAVFRNATISNLTEVAVRYTGEQWRKGGSGVTNALQFEFALSPVELQAFPPGFAGTRVGALDFHSPATEGVASALDGNAAANSRSVSGVLTLSPPLPPGQFLVILWRDCDETGSDDGLAVDDLTIEWRGFAPPTPTVGLLAFWHMNHGLATNTSMRPLRPFGVPAAPQAALGDHGLMAAQLDPWFLAGSNGGSDANNFGAYDGNTRNWPDEAGAAVAADALAVSGSSNNGRFLELRFDRAVTNCTLSYATRGTSSGFTNHACQISTDGGGNWQPAGEQPSLRTTSWGTRTFELGGCFAASHGPGRNRIRLQFDGASGSTGNNRFDNLQLRGAFPLALVALRCDPPGAGTVSGGGFLEVGTAASLTATAGPGSCFVAWSDGCSDACRCILVPAEGLALQARFAITATVMLVR